MSTVDRGGAHSEASGDPGRHLPPGRAPSAATTGPVPGEAAVLEREAASEADGLPAADPEALLGAALRASLDRLALVVRGVRPGRLQGERQSPRRGRSVEFADFRPYAPGDDVRQIDWRAYARLERVFLKLFVEEEDACVHLVVDRSRSMAWGRPPKLDAARRIAAALGYVALAGPDSVAPAGVAIGGTPGRGDGQPLRGRAAVPRLLAGLDALQAGGGTDLVASLRRYAAAARRPGPLVLLSDLSDPRWQSGLAAAHAAGYLLTVVHILSPDEVAPPLEGDLALVDDETGETVEVTVDARVRAAYAAALAAWRADIKGWCRSRDVPYVPVESDVDVAALVTGALRRQGVVA